jgi:hypothetical protein
VLPVADFKLLHARSTEFDGYDEDETVKASAHCKRLRLRLHAYAVVADGSDMPSIFHH